MGAAHLTHVDLLAFEPAGQELLGEALVVDAVGLLELDHGLRAQVANGAFDAGGCGGQVLHIDLKLFKN